MEKIIKSFIISLLIIITLTSKSFSQTEPVPNNLSDFLHEIPPSLVPPNPCGVNMGGIIVGDNCNDFLLNQTATNYDNYTLLITKDAFDDHVIRNFQYTVAGEEKVTNGINVDLASPKAKLSGVTSLKDGSVYLRLDFGGGLSDDGKSSPIFTSNNFNTEITTSIGVAWLTSNNNSSYDLDGDIKKLLHMQILSASRIQRKRADTLLALNCWMHAIYTSTPPPVLFADPIYDYFTDNFTSYATNDPSTGIAWAGGAAVPGPMATHFETMMATTSVRRLQAVNLTAFNAYLKKFSDIKIPESVLKTALTIGYFTPIPNHYEYLEQSVNQMQDSLARPYWTKDVITWWGADLRLRHLQLNGVAEDGVSNKTTGSPFHDIGLTVSYNYLVTNPRTRSRFCLLRAYGAVGEGYNARNLPTIKIDKDIYYKGELKQLVYGSLGLEAYGNPFKIAGLPGIYFNTRFDYSASYRNPWIISVEFGPLFNLQDKKSNNFAFITPTFGFTDIAEPNVDISNNFFWSLKVGIPVNIKYK